MKKIVLTFCIITACILILTSFNPVIGYFSVKNSKNKDSPLFTLRVKRVQNLHSSSITSEYLGKNVPLEIIFPTRYIIKKDMLIELSKIDIQNKIDIGDTEILNKWQFVLQIAGNNLAVINKILRKDSETFKHLVETYNDLSAPELQNIFLTHLHS